MYHMDADKILKKLDGYETSKTNKTCGTMLEKRGRAYNRRSSMDPFAWTCLCWLTCKNLSTIALVMGCSWEDLPREMDDRDEWRERVRNTCARSATIYIYIYIYIYLVSIFKRVFRAHFLYIFDRDKNT